MIQGYNLSFKLFLEGVLVPFESANVICTPNGMEASINILANRAVYDLKPKTAVQIFYHDWVPDKKGRLGWRLMFDGAISGFYKVDQALEGKMVSIACKDFRIDIRRAPAAIAYASDQELGSQQLYSMNGIFSTYVVKGKSKKQNDNTTKDNSKTDKETPAAATQTTPVQPTDPTGGFLESVKPAASTSLPSYLQVNNSPQVQIMEYGGELNPLSDMLRIVAGTAYGDGAQRQPNGEYHYTNSFGSLTHDSETGKAKCGFFLDALVRSMWSQAVGGTSVGQFINKRARVDKRFLIPSNRAGYNIWNRQSAGLEVGSYVLGNARFTSVEAAIMRIAGLFSTRVYSCSTPCLIPIGDDVNGKPNPSVEMIMDSDVRNFLIKDPAKDFGGKFILNETMLLPALEFTAPPNCNIFLPPVYDRVTWQYDIDADATRGYYKIVDSLSLPDSEISLDGLSVQVPNALFDIYKGNGKDMLKRVKPPLTLDERYTGINVTYGSVEYNLAADDASIGQIDAKFKPEKAKEIRERIAKLKSMADNASGTMGPNPDAATVSAIEKEQNDKLWKEKQDEIQRRRVAARESELHDVTHSSVMISAKRHALLKFLNTRYAGRVASVDMSFNPYVMCGFPGMVVDDEEAAGNQASKSIIGMVQQVKHLIYISTDGAQVSTSVVMNNIRFIDEPVDIDSYGNPLYMKATDQSAAKINNDNLWYSNTSYYIPDPKTQVKSKLLGGLYDLEQNVESTDYIYVKDVLSLTEKDHLAGKSNTIHIDQEYEPQRISRFYRDVLQHREDHFMIGVNENGDKFAYDTIHEAVVKLRKTRIELLYDYSAAIRFISRNVCSADAFYQGILGLSVLRDGKYVCNESNFDDTIIDDEYYGVTTDFYNDPNNNGLKSTAQFKQVGGLQNESTTISAAGPGLMDGPGDFSSILETMPETAFIKERRIAVKNYIKIAKETAQGMTFSLPTGKE